MTKFADVVAAMLGVLAALVLIAYASADSSVRTTCDIETNNPLSQTSCVIKDTLN